ncbi:MULTISPECIES: carbonic anhydrase [Sorangium]|uniref:Carbonic anhydrase n=1 Tax=Sorangium cellulosum (strain So ce56) TaxID=448385 RepID=A9GX76_SORC5|nr:carbonic anhydrase [Sorangium cellulosum]CAN97057.1 cynT [Sorangium cellulosum So ce56]
MQKLADGLHKFHAEVCGTHQDLFRNLARGQRPEALFITCSDSRINPNLITQTQPGDIFIVRNVGNIVPPYGAGNGSEAAAMEFAVAHLGIKHIIVCGHTHCGAMRGLLDSAGLDELPAVKGWLQHAELTRRLVQENYPHIEGEDRLTITVEENVLAQIENLRTHPTIRARLARGELSLYAWVFKIETGQVFQFEASTGQFGPIGDAAPPSALPESTVYRRAV